MVENFKPGTTERMGIDYATLAAENPGLVYCSITGFGQSGPYAARPGYDFLVQAMGGLMSSTSLNLAGCPPASVSEEAREVLRGMPILDSIASRSSAEIGCAVLGPTRPASSRR